MNVDNRNLSESNSVGTIIGGAVPYVLKKYIHPAVSTEFMNSMCRLNLDLTQPEKDVLEKASDKALINSKLDKKGVVFERVNENTKMTNEEDAVIKNIDRMNISKNIKEAKKEMALPKYCAMKGHNAYFNPLTNSVIYNKDKFALPVFHELGHAKNKFYSKIGGFLQRHRNNNMKAAGVISALAILAPSKTEEKIRNLNTDDDKLVAKFRDNAGILTAAALAPTVIEEGMATYHGNKMAKELLNPELLKKVKKCNAKGFATYALLAGVMGIGTDLGIKLKNKIVKNGVSNKNN
ncbi:MAG: hypothetical protein LUB59_06550 [Candidatus Gastranaerophilales bacterium]|nr:hypothetical protein [Candidatus Gastranaerophilales bacterium]